MRGRDRFAAVILALPLSGDWQPPAAAITRKAFETAYPKASVSAAALELEALSARIGIDAAPAGEQREHPDAAAAAAVQSAVSAAGQYVHDELENPVEKVGAPSRVLAAYLEENAPTLDAIAAVESGRREIVWNLDVSGGVESPLPNFLGLSHLQRVLGARALIEMRNGETDAALVTLDGMWRVCESLASRPELISHLIVMGQARLVVGLLRKVDGPAFGWPERLRSGGFYQAFLAAFQNDPWAAAADPDYADSVEMLARIHRRIAEDLIAHSPCEWTRDELARSWEVAVSGEKDPNAAALTIGSDMIIDMVVRSHRFLLDEELTALILEARIDKYASREGAWPPRLPNLESAVCPGRFYTYRRSGGVTLSFEGSVPQGDSRALVLPMSFRGAPPPTPTPTPKLTVTPTPPPLTPPAPGGMILPR